MAKDVRALENLMMYFRYVCIYVFIRFIGKLVENVLKELNFSIIGISFIKAGKYPLSYHIYKFLWVFFCFVKLAKVFCPFSFNRLIMQRVKMCRPVDKRV